MFRALYQSRAPYAPKYIPVTVIPQSGRCLYFDKAMICHRNAYPKRRDTWMACTTGGSEKEKEEILTSQTVRSVAGAGLWRWPRVCTVCNGCTMYATYEMYTQVWGLRSTLRTSSCHVRFVIIIYEYLPIYASEFH